MAAHSVHSSVAGKSTAASRTSRAATEQTDHETIQVAFNPSFVSFRNLPSDLKPGADRAHASNESKEPWRAGKAAPTFQTFTYEPEPDVLQRIADQDHRKAKEAAIKSVHGDTRFSIGVKPLPTKAQLHPGYELGAFLAPPPATTAIALAAADVARQPFRPSGVAGRLRDQPTRAMSAEAVTALYRRFSEDWPDCEVVVWETNGGLIVAAFDVQTLAGAADAVSDARGDRLTGLKAYCDTFVKDGDLSVKYGLRRWNNMWASRPRSCEEPVLFFTFRTPWTTGSADPFPA